jgi:N-ethylmaleimide reductase
VTAAVVDAWSADRVGVRLSPRSRFNSMSDSDRPAIFQHAVRRLNQFGLAYLHLVDPITGSSDEGAEARLAPELRKSFEGPIVLNGGFDRETAGAALERGEADLISFGVPFLANPDLPARLRGATALNPPQRATFYGGDSRGYTDYPFAERHGGESGGSSAGLALA